MKNIYVISGLGADERVFFKTDFGYNNVTHIKWLAPIKNENIENYALRLTAQIKNKNPVLVGLSFGGMMAMEVAKHIETDKIILISSAKTTSDLPLFFKFAGKINLHKCVPTYLLKSANIFTNWAFSTRSKADKKILAAMIKDTDIKFLKWAIDAILKWQNKAIHQNVIHIHGTADRILPFKKNKNTITVNGGPHLMIVTKAAEISKIIRDNI